VLAVLLLQLATRYFKKHVGFKRTWACRDAVYIGAKRRLQRGAPNANGGSAKAAMIAAPLPLARLLAQKGRRDGKPNVLGRIAGGVLLAPQHHRQCQNLNLSPSQSLNLSLSQLRSHFIVTTHFGASHR
jgi:hypothetical protein